MTNSISLGIINTSYISNFQKPRPKMSYIAHKGSLEQHRQQHDLYYSIKVKNDLRLNYDRMQYERISNLFCIIDTDSKGFITQSQLREFVKLRCPLFRRRDELLENNGKVDGSDSTFDEVWSSVITSDPHSTTNVVLGIEGFAIFCRFIALAQYLEAKQRFSHRHSQKSQNNIIMVEVPPPLPPGPLTISALKEYEEKKEKVSIAFPELDLNHCLVASHDGKGVRNGARVVVTPYGDGRLSSSPSSSSLESYVSSEEEFVVSFTDTKVRRTITDMEWLHNTIKSHQVLGGTLCGRILPPFPKKQNDYSMLNTFVKNILWATSPNKEASATYSKRLERCLNYLLEHPALFTSFPLNAILKASQIGLQAAKGILEEESLVFDIPTVTPASSFLSNLSWVRTAAQAAMALKLHGILDATGYASYSARLQHASLPNLDTSNLWRGECSTPPPKSQDECFENGVVKIQSELEDTDDEYDLLPSVNDSKRYSYGPLHDSPNPASIDSDIDKLSELITSVHSTLSRCSIVSQTISDAKRERDSFHSNIVRGLDSWISLRGYELMNERALLNAVKDLEHCVDIRVVSDAQLNDTLSWQASLASCAVSATQDVKSAIQASNTAMSAKAAAESAALSAQKAYESLSNTTTKPDDLRIVRTRASISHSHAIYAAVIQHESFVAKRKAALALAHDVKFWNLYRKREILRTCLDTARSQKEAASKAVDAWELLRVGLFGQTEFNSPVISKKKSIDTPSASFTCPKIIPVDHVALAKDDNITQSTESIEPQKNENDLTSSMQSLVDGLMTWGFAQGQYDPQDDMSLPTGMAVSIALEETTK